MTTKEAMQTGVMEAMEGVEAMELVKILVWLDGLAPIMFDRFIDHSKEQRPPEQKFYLAGDNEVVLPTECIRSFLFGTKRPGCAAQFEGKKANTYISAGRAFLAVMPDPIPFTRDGEPVVFKKFDDKTFSVFYSAGLIGSGRNVVKNEASPRPRLHLPWRLEFELHLIKNPVLDEIKLHNWFNKGGLFIALGTHRNEYGRFRVAKWEVS